MNRERAGVTALFFVNGVVFSSFFARLPAIKDDLGASDGQLGLALLAGTGALLLAQPLAGALVVRFGARPAALAGMAGYAAALPFTALAGSVGLLALALFCMSFANGVLDVASNAEGAAVERRLGRRVLSSMHAAFSFGAMAGAGGGALAAAVGLDPAPHLASAAVVALALAAPAAGALPRGRSHGGGPSFARPSGRLMVLGAVAFCVLLAEGSVTDWSAIYLADETGASEALAAVGLAAFSLLMAAGRLSGDGLAEGLGAAAVVRAGSAIAAAGLALALATAAPGFGIAGFALMGAGLAATFPLVVAAAARVPGVEGAPGIAAVSTAGYGAFMAGPAVIGLLSDTIGLRSALLLVLALCVAAAVLARTVATPGGRGRRSPGAPAPVPPRGRG